MVILSAPWIVPVVRPVIKDGAVVIEGGAVLEVGRRQDILQKYPGACEKAVPGVLLPGLVNAHMHLELSCLAVTGDEQQGGGFTEWIEALLQKRSEQHVSEEVIQENIHQAILKQHESGVVLIGDIGNVYYPMLHRKEGESRPIILRMIEFLGPNREASKLATQRLARLEQEICATGHSPYSTGPSLLKKIKDRCNSLNQVFSIHTAESSEEGGFLLSGDGPFRDFLVKRNSWDGMFPFEEKGYRSTVEYFHHLNLLDKNTLLVHCVHVSSEDLRLIKERGSHICLCPGSNLYLGVGLAPVDRMVQSGLLPAIGTDSPASNEDTDIWREMRLLWKSFPQLEASDILEMATTGGARALGYGRELGGLAVGKKADVLHVASANLSCCGEGRQLVKELVSGGRPAEIEWISSAHD